ncbi:MAG: serine dehydratase subunit alpha family protein [Paludibacteraceae bacterium]|jgi:L-cysteine desulfidase|nr:serine dehydratase subunit alpha family protein [Paludibacteraceae bacterium]
MNNTELLHLLHSEVIPAIGCTEPIAVALCVARAKELLGELPETITVSLSKNVYKNAFAVGIPNTGMTGLPIAIALGATVGKSEYMLEVLRDATPEAVAYAKEYMLRVPAQIHINYDAPSILYIHAKVSASGRTAQATIMDEHTKFVENNEAKGERREVKDERLEAKGEALTLRRVYDFATSVETSELTFLLEGAKMNTAAAETSFADQYGHGLGRLLRANTLSATPEMHRLFGDTLFTKIISYTCGACDARMSGAMVPVMSNSGSGNQGISCSIPVYLYAKENHCSEEQTLRALALSNLTVIYIKQSLGRLSALCGCVVAATGSAAGITYLMGGKYEEITYAIKNMIANISGMICDGAKPGCALKVTSGVATAIFSSYLAMQHSVADSTEGIIEEDIDRTIRNLTRIGHDGMQVTDDLILDIMTHKK